MRAPAVPDVVRGASAAAFEDTPVAFAYLFGSHATGRARDDSDVDVAVYLQPDDPSERLSQTLDLGGRIAAASGLPRVEVVVMNGAPLPLLGSILRERIVVYSRDEPARVTFESEMRSVTMDFEIHARRLDRELLARTADGGR